MYQIKNTCDKDIVISYTIDRSVKGCRVLNMGPELLKPDEMLQTTAYEPGVLIVITPADEPDKQQGYEELHMEG